LTGPFVNNTEAVVGFPGAGRSGEAAQELSTTPSAIAPKCSAASGTSVAGR